MKFRGVEAVNVSNLAMVAMGISIRPSYVVVSPNPKSKAKMVGQSVNG